MDITDALKITAQWYERTKSARIDTWGASSWRSLQRDLVLHAGIQPGSFVLDIGTGTGGTAIEAACKTGSEGFVIGIDNVPSLLEIAQNEALSNGLTNVAFVAADMGRLGFADEAFEHVISSFAIYGSFPPGVGIQEAYRVLKRGGLVTFSMFGNFVRGDELWCILETIFKRYQLASTDPFSTAVKEAFKVIPYGFFPYGPLAEPADPGQVLRFLNGLGFNDVEAGIKYVKKTFPKVDNLLAWFAAYNLELSEIGSELVASFEKDCAAAVQPFFLDQEPCVEIEVIYFGGQK